MPVLTVVVRPEHVETEAEMGKQLERMAEVVLRRRGCTGSACPSGNVEDHIANVLRCFDHFVRCHYVVKLKRAAIVVCSAPVASIRFKSAMPASRSASARS